MKAILKLEGMRGVRGQGAVASTWAVQAQDGGKDEVEMKAVSRGAWEDQQRQQEGYLSLFSQLQVLCSTKPSSLSYSLGS